MVNHIEASLREARMSLDKFLQNKQAMQDIANAAAAIIQAFERECRVFSCGNGGSMCNAMHFAEELTGRYRQDSPALSPLAISATGCVGNELVYDQVASRYLKVHGRRGDCLLAITTFGTNKNVIQAVHAAKALDMTVIALTGRHNPELKAISDIYVCTPNGNFADRVLELHIKVLHILNELIERHFFPTELRQELVA